MGISTIVLEKYKDYFNWLLLTREVRESTARMYVDNLRCIFNHTDAITKENLLTVHAKLKAEGKRNSYLNHLCTTARLYTMFLRDKGLPYDDGILTIKKLKQEAILRATMSDTEIEAFLKLKSPIKSLTYKCRYYRFTLFFSICAYTGMRPSEVSHLTVDTCDLGRMVFILEKTKTIPRVVPIPPNIVDKLKERIAECDNYLFPSISGSKEGSSLQNAVVDSVDWGYNFQTRIKRLGIKRKGLTPYSLRHSLITQLIDEDVSLFKVKSIVGHSDLKTTLKYYHPSIKAMKEGLSKHPTIRKSLSPFEILDAFKEIVGEFEFEKNRKFDFSMSETHGELNLKLRIQ